MSDINYGALIGTGIDALNAYNESRGRNNIYDILKAREDANYAQAKQQYESDAAYQAALGAYRSRSAAGAASAAAANAASQQAALKRSLRTQNKTYDNVMGEYAPYRSAALELLPKQTKTYGGTLDTIDAMRALYSSPNALATMSGSIAAQQVPLQLPDYIRGAR